MAISLTHNIIHIYLLSIILDIQIVISRPHIFDRLTICIILLSTNKDIRISLLVCRLIYVAWCCSAVLWFCCSQARPRPSMPDLIAFLSQTGNVMKTTLAAATALELVKAGMPVLSIDIDREHRQLGSLSTWANDRRQHYPERDQLMVATPDTANDAFELINQTDPDTIVVLDCPSRASTATAAIAQAVDLVVFPIVPGKKDAHLSLHSIHAMIAADVDPQRIAIVPTRCMTAFEIADLARWIKAESPYGEALSILSPALMEKPSYRNAIAKGLAITEAQPFSLQRPARAVIDAIINQLHLLTLAPHQDNAA